MSRIGQGTGLGHLSCGHQEISGVHRRSRSALGHHLRRKHGSLGHHVPMRVLVGAEPAAGSAAAPRKDGVVDFTPGFFPCGDMAKTGGGGGASGSFGKACWGWDGVMRRVPCVQGHRDRIRSRGVLAWGLHLRRQRARLGAHRRSDRRHRDRREQGLGYPPECPL